MRNRLLVFFVAFIFILLAACGQQKNDVQPEPIIEEPPDPIEFEEQVDPYLYPLTGQGTDTEVTDRPVMVMVENSPAARPQSGLHQADIVYEILAEGDITRFIAVYQSQSPEIIGPVRSIRPYFIRIGDGLDTIIVHAGWSPEAKQMLIGQGRPNINQVAGGDHVYFWRSKERRAPHNVYTSMELIRQGAEDKQFREEWKDVQILFADEGLTDGEEAKRVTIPYIGRYHVNYEYDEVAGHYKRYMMNEPHQDKESGEQLIAHNIIVAAAQHQILDNEGRREINVEGPGEGYLFQHGKVQSITWESKNGIIRVYNDGQELPWVPGKTWIHIVPMGAEVTFE